VNTDIPDISVPRNKYDIIFKAMSEQFQEQILTFYGIHLPPIVRAAPNELPTVNVKEHRMDCVFVLADESYLYLKKWGEASRTSERSRRIGKSYTRSQSAISSNGHDNSHSGYVFR
jgi:hypothetical protein